MRGRTISSGYGRPSKAAPDDVLAREAEDLLVRRVHVDPLQAAVPEHQRVGRGVEHRPILFLAAAQRFLGTDAPGDVADRGDHGQPAVEREPIGGDLDREHGAVLPAMPAQGNVHPSDGHADRIERVARLRREVGHRQCEQLVAVIAPQVLGGGIGVHQPQGRHVHQQQRIGLGLEQQPVARLARSQALLGSLPLGDVAHEGQHPRLARDGRALQGHVVPEQVAVLVARVPLESQGRLAQLGPLDQRERLGLGVRRHVLAHHADAEVAHLDGRIAVQPLGRGAHVEDPAGVPVVRRRCSPRSPRRWRDSSLRTRAARPRRGAARSPRRCARRRSSGSIRSAARSRAAGGTWPRSGRAPARPSPSAGTPRSRPCP